jgi:RimJ/RimL family protein N-acetyltransferase
MLRGETTNLRALERSDLDRNLRWVNDREVTEHLLLRYPMSEESERAWLEDVTARPPSYTGGVHFAIEIAADASTGAGEHIGNCGFQSAHPLDRSAELGVMIGAKEHWGRGHGYDALRTLLAFGFRALNLRRIWLRVDADHPRAIALYERLGFRGEGLLRSTDWRRGHPVDVLVMGILRAEFDARYGAFEAFEDVEAGDAPR